MDSGQRGAHGVCKGWMGQRDMEVQRNVPPPPTAVWWLQVTEQTLLSSADRRGCPWCSEGGAPQRPGPPGHLRLLCRLSAEPPPCARSGPSHGSGRRCCGSVDRDGTSPPWASACSSTEQEGVQGSHRTAPSVAIIVTIGPRNRAQCRDLGSGPHPQGPRGPHDSFAFTHGRVPLGRSSPPAAWGCRPAQRRPRQAPGSGPHLYPVTAGKVLILSGPQIPI